MEIPADRSEPDAATGPLLTAGAVLAEQLPLLVQLLDGEASALTDAERADGVVALAKLCGQVDAAFVALTGDWDGRTVWTADGARSGAAWLSARTELPRQGCAAAVHLGRDLRSCPAVATAFADGVLGRAKVAMLMRARTRVETVFADHEAALIDEIRSLTVDQARVVIGHWRRLALATVGAEADGSDDPAVPDDPEDDNRFHLSGTFDGRFVGDLDLDPVSGTELANALNARIDQWFRDGTATATDGIGRSRRQAMALMDLVRHGAEPRREHGQARPSVSVVLDFDEVVGTAADGPADAVRRRCHLDDGTPINRSTAERLLGDGSVVQILRRLGMDGHDHVIAVTSAARTCTPRQRRALDARDGGCQFPGCHQSGRGTDAHHVDHWSRTRSTDIKRMVLLCAFHHRLIHRGFTLYRDRSGTVTVTTPDGHTLIRAGPGQQVLREDQGGPPSSPLRPARGPVRPATRFRTLTERRTADEREDDWHAAQIEATYAALHQRASVLAGPA